ncbi:MAG: PAS domain-containing protein [Xenococcaceae cyanobacterium]
MHEHNFLTENILTNKVETNSPTAAANSTQCLLLGDSQICGEAIEHFWLFSIDLFCIAGFDGYFKWINPAWAKTFGYTDADLLAKPYLEFVHPEDRAATIAEAEKLKAGCQTIEFHNRYCCKDGSYRWLSWNVTVDPQKQLIYCIARDITANKHKEDKFIHTRCFTSDVTERKQLEQQLKRSIAHLSNLKLALDRSAIVAITDRQGIITEVNDRFCQLSKYSREELLGQDHRPINSGYHPKSFFQDLWSTIASGNVWKGEIKNRAKDGSYYWVDTTIVPFLDDRGQPWQYLAIRFDITSLKQVEEALKQNEERWQLALQGNKDGIWDWNVKTNEVFFSPRWKEMLGYEDREISNHLDEWSKRVHPDDLETALQDVQNHLARKTDYYVNEHRLKCKDGSYKWILDRGKAREKTWTKMDSLP